MTERWIALLGRCDKPTDAVEDYCRFLGEALLREQNVELCIERVAWDEAGWPSALEDLRRRTSAWRGQWILAQYTALAWSARGFPGRFLRVLRILRDSGARVGIVFHDVEPYAGQRLVDKLRRKVQANVMRRALDLADSAIFTVPAEKLSWQTRKAGSVKFIPVGANLPLGPDRELSEASGRTKNLTLAVFGITGGEAGEHETREILQAVREAAQRAEFRLAVFGRHAEARETMLRDGLRDLAVDISVEGVLDGPQVVQRLRAADVLLFVRGGISTRRSSAIAAIACGLPVIARAGSETAAPITEAGVAFYEDEGKVALGAVLARTLRDAGYRAELAQRSREAYRNHFSWSAIAKKYVAALRRDA